MLLLYTLLFAVAFSKCPFFKGHDIEDRFGTECNEHDKGADPDENQRTYKGCECASACGGTLDFNYGTCDWCYTKNNCGYYAISRLRYYDYCVYPANDETASWDRKQDSTWDLVTANKRHGDWGPLQNIFVESVMTTFDNAWDYMPATREKLIHSIGAVCKIDMAISSFKYTGIFQTGSAKGLVRMGPANDFTSSAFAMTPGMGFKFFRTNQESANWVTLFSLDGDPTSYDYFKNNQSNHIPVSDNILLQPLVDKFEQASGCAEQVGLSHAAAWNQDGTKTDNPIFPHQILFEPTGYAKIIFGDAELTVDELFAGFARIAVNTPLFNVYAKDSPRSNYELIGTVTTLSECVQSAYGDASLFFRHQRIEEDWQIMQSRNQDWRGSQDLEATCGHSSVNLNPPADCSTYKPNPP